MKFADDLLPTISQAEAIAFINNRAERDSLLSAMIQAKHSDKEMYSIVLASKGVASRRLSFRKPPLDNQKAMMVWQQLQKCRQEIGKISNFGFVQKFSREPNKAELARLPELTKQREQLERELAKYSKFHKEKIEQKQLTVDALLRELPANTALIDFVMVARWKSGDKNNFQKENSYEVFIIQKNHENVHSIKRISLGANDANDLVVSWRREVSSGGGGLRGDGLIFEPKNKNDSGAKLGQKLWSPIQKLLHPEIENLIIVPDGQLGLMPWGAIPVSNNKYLVENYTLSTLTHAQLLLGQPKQAKYKNALLIGGVDYKKSPIQQKNPQFAFAKPPITPQIRGGWAPLPYTEKEVQQIAKLLPVKSTKILSNDQATEDAIRNFLPTKDILHLATHGFFVSNKSRQVQKNDRDPFWLDYSRRNPLSLVGLALSGAATSQSSDDWNFSNDGILSGEEVLSLPLENTKLVVLSACETGIGELAEGEGVFGLQRAFHASGVKTTVASLWKVDDAASQCLMVEFYKGLLEKNLPPAQALSSAQRKMLNRYDLKQRKFSKTRLNRKTPLPPRYWAAFQIGG